MRIAIMGAGALGAYFGARLFDAGYDVTLIARGAHLNAIRTDGLFVDSPNGNLHLADIPATDDPSQVGHVDCLLFFVKNYDLDGALEQAALMIGPDTFVATFQNGITAPHVAAKALGAERVLGGAAWIPGYIEAPGRIKHTDTNDTLSFGALVDQGRVHEKKLLKALKDAGTRPAVAETIEDALWAKFVMLAATSAVSTLTRLTFGEIRDEPKTKALMHQSLLEAAKVARAVRPDLPDDLAEKQFEFFLGMGDQVRASMCTDFLNGKRLELDWFSGEIVRRGKEHSIATPVHEVTVAALWPYRNGALSA